MLFYTFDVSTWNSSGHCRFNLSSKWTTKENVQLLCNIASKYFQPDKITVSKKEFNLDYAKNKPNYFKLDNYNQDDLTGFDAMLSGKKLLD